MRKTGMGRELRKESIACRPCSLNFDNKLLREVPDFCAAHLQTVNIIYHKKVSKDLPCCSHVCIIIVVALREYRWPCQCCHQSPVGSVVFGELW